VQCADAPEIGEQLLGERLGHAPRDREAEQIFDQLMIEQRVAAAGNQPSAMPRPVPGAVG